MVFGLCSQRERLYSLLYAINIFILTGVAYYYFQGSVGKTAPVHEIAVESSQPIGETLRPVWGPMDKCYPVTTQRRRVRSRKKHDSEAMTPKAMGGPNNAAPKEETAVLSREEGEVGPLGEEAASLIPGAKRVTEKEEVAGTPGWQENKKARKEAAVYVSEASEVDIVEERPGGWVPQPLKKLWLGWFPASDIPKTQSHE
ncbi:uncharacterized protein LOC122423708 [Cervus canadensis]|uniref:uncharacterized protein LOC122423708 n=1 Tax=Cervus canadensis TaxID=1574408 RepID=UPI001CA35035|nr:uncharacterized protein LOC122423708 [Cervus canadensis]XP_043296943.1 uncharacterized protein LOC122423708 [Cervus canadensis]